MAPDPGTSHGSADRFDASRFFQFSLEIRELIYSFVRDEPEDYEWNVDPETVSGDEKPKGINYVVVDLTLHDPPCASLLQVNRFREEYEATLKYTVTVRFRDPEGMPDPKGMNEEVSDKRHTGATKFIREICRRLKNITIYVHMYYVTCNREYIRFRPAQTIEWVEWEYNRLTDFMAVLLELTVAEVSLELPVMWNLLNITFQDHPQRTHSSDRKPVFFNAMTAPKFPRIDGTPLQAINVGIVYEYVKHNGVLPDVPFVDSPDTPMPRPPAQLAAFPLVHQDQGNIVHEIDEERYKREFEVQPGDTCEGWVEHKVMALS